MAPSKTNPTGRPQASVKGKIMQLDGKPVDQARITLMDKRNNVVAESTSDLNGDYTIGGVLPNEYIIKVEKENFEMNVNKDVILNDKDEKSVDVKLKEYAPPQETKAPIWLGVGFWVFIFGIVGYNYFNIGDRLRKMEDLQILARQTVSNQQIKIEGKVVFEGHSFDEISVWAVATDEQGNKISPELQRVDSTGRFIFKPVPLAEFGDPSEPKIIDIEVAGKAKVYDSKQRAEGKTHLQLNTYQLDIVASVKKKEKDWIVEGKILSDGSSVENLQVEVIAKNGRDESYSPDTDTIFASTGRFSMEPIPGWFVTDTVEYGAEIAVLASGVSQEGTRLSGKKILRLGSGTSIRPIDLSVTPFVVIPLIFFFSVLLAIFEFKDNNLAFKYYSAIILAFIFTAIMIAYIVSGLRTVNKMGLEEHEEVASLGIASIFYGTYVNDIEPQWLFSLTSPSKKELNTIGNHVAKGFGAPLWVLLLSVIGAGLFTINIIVEGVKERIGSMTVDNVRATIQKIILHEFYVFFSPIGAIFVYQLLVAGGAASQHITVAIAVLAAGLALNLLLEKALELINKNLKSA